MGKERDEEIAELLWGAARALHERLSQEKMRGRYTILQIKALRFIGEKQPSMRPVAERFGITAPSATSLIDGLEKEGLVLREEDARDRRSFELSLTKKGKRALSQAKKVLARKISIMLEPLSPSETEQLKRILKKISTLS